jgi:ABC-2 type transport system ATP-binding protein
MTDGLPAVAVNNVTKRFTVRRSWADTILHPFDRSRLLALDSVTLEVAPGECFGLLGPNGAGKTTLFKVLATLIQPDEGSAAVMGQDTVTQGDAVRRSMAPVIANERSLYWRLSARENLRLFAALHGLETRAGEVRVTEVLETVGLVAAADRMVAQYSTGMKQRLLIARALLARPAVLLLDEPTRSLDPMSAEEFRRFLREDILHRHGCTVMLATHDAEEVRDLCDRVAILNEGRILTTGVTQDLIEAYGESTFHVWTTDPDHEVLTPLRAHHDDVPGDGWWRVAVRIPGGPDRAAAFLARLIEEGVPVSRFEKAELSLADLLRRVLNAHPGNDG